jgi:hypothetical protein
MAMRAIEMTYIGTPDIPAGMTITEFRRTRARTAPRKLRIFKRR